MSNIDLSTIIPNQGIGQIKFGMTREQIKFILGEPDEVEDVNLEEVETIGESWHYDEIELSLSFDSENDWALSDYSVTNPISHISGKIHVGMNQQALLDCLEEMAWDDIETESWENGGAEEIYLIESAQNGIMFWMDEGVLSEIQCYQA